MAKFFKNFFSSSTVRIKEKPAEGNFMKGDEKKSKSYNNLTSDFTPPYNTAKKMSISRSGRMKQNLKVRGKLNGELFGKEEHRTSITALEYRVNKSEFFDDDPNNSLKINNSVSLENLSNYEDSHQNPKNSEIKNKEHESSIKNSINDIDDEHDTASILENFEKDIQQIMQYRESDF